LIDNVGGAIDIQAPGGDLTLVGSSSNFADVGGTGGTLNNSGALMIDSSAVLDNYATITSSGTFTNTGTLNNQAGGTLVNGGTLTNNASFINYGSLANSGTLTSNLYFFNDGAIDNSGNVTVSSSGVLYGNGTGSFTQTAGSLTVDGQMVQGPITIAGGTLGGSGLIGGNVTVDGGTVGPGNSPGQLYLFGDIDFLAGSTFAAELGGLAFGTDYDRLDVSGTASLAAGTMFDIDFFGAFTAGLGDTFDVLVADDIQAALLSTMLFDFTGAALGSGLAWDFGIVDFGGGRDSLRLSVIEGGIAAIPAPAAAFLFGLGLFGIGFTRRFQGRRRAI
jgi:fibronectin-binding autotransporter adhesin